MSDGWEWELTERGRRQFDGLDDYGRERICSKLNEVVDDPWRDPMDYLEPLQGAPHQKLRVGLFCLDSHANREGKLLHVFTIRKRVATHTGLTTTEEG